jgi:hypothetical protein
MKPQKLILPTKAKKNLSTIENHTNNTNPCWLEKLLCFILLPGFFWSAAGWTYVTIPDRYRSEMDFRARAIRTFGIVTNKNKQTICFEGLGACTSICNVTVNFQTNQGRTVVFSGSCKSANGNQTVPVLYDPDSAPVKARIDRRDISDGKRANDFILSFICLFLGMGSLVAGFSIYGTKHTALKD